MYGMQAPDLQHPKPSGFWQLSLHHMAELYPRRTFSCCHMQEPKVQSCLRTVVCCCHEQEPGVRSCLSAFVCRHEQEPRAKSCLSALICCHVQVPRVKSRLSTFLTRFEARQQLAEAHNSLQGHQRAHQELRSSPCLAAALQHSLALGNFLNWGTRLGQAAGFRLRNLPKLQVTSQACLQQWCTAVATTQHYGKPEAVVQVLRRRI